MKIDHHKPWALVPVRSLDGAKSRLAPRLDAGQRARLVEWMLGRVLQAARASNRLAGTIVVAGDEPIAALARKNGAMLCPERRPAGMNQAIDLGLEFCRAKAINQVLVLPADIPAISASDIDAVIAAGRDRQCTIACPDRWRQGTNALLMPTRSDFCLRYGRDSFAAHRQSAIRAGLSFAVIDNRAIAHDIDTPADLVDFPLSWDCLPGAYRSPGLRCSGSSTRALAPRSDIGD